MGMTSRQQFWASTIDGLTQGSIYALVALGYTLVYGVLRLINFAHSEIFMIGTFAAVGVTDRGRHHGPADRASRSSAVAARCWRSSCATAVRRHRRSLLERIAYRPLRKRGATRLAALISAIGASLFLQQLFASGVIRGRR